MTTATKPAPAAQAKPDVTVTPEEHVAAVRSFMHTCLRVRYVKVGLPKSRQASDGARAGVAEQAGGADEDSFSVSKRLFKGGKDAHPVIDQVSEWQRKVDKWRNAFTFSMAADDTADAGSLRKARGERLIRADDVDAFEAGLLAMEAEGLEISRRFYEQYEQILGMEQARLKKEFNKADYPARDAVWQAAAGDQEETGLLRIGRRHYSEVTASVRLPKAVLEKMTVQAAELMNQSVEVAVGELSKTLTDTFTTLAGQLVDRLCVKPRAGTPLYKKTGGEAEILLQKTHADDANVPKGKRVLTLAWKAGRQTIKEDAGPFTDEEYEALRPQPMDATKRIDKRVMERFEQQLDTFQQLRTKLGAYGGHMDDALEALRDLYHKGVNSAPRKAGAEAVIETAKYSADYRRKLKDALNDVSDTLSAVAEEARQVRRKVHASIAQKIAAGEDEED